MEFRPLTGIKVVDVTSSLAGPYCTEMLGALGADVVKIEHPERGDEARAWGPEFFPGGSVMFFAANAGKRSLGLDVKRGLDVLYRLAEQADVFIQSLRPGTAERLGFGPDELRSRNERLVYCSIGSFGRTGPLAGRPGYDPLMQAFGGIISVTGEPDRPGVRIGASPIDQGTGMWAALGIVAALLERATTGVGRVVDVSLFETTLALLPYQLAETIATGALPKRHGTAFPLIAPYEVFDTADGQLMIAAANDRLFALFCEAVGRPELVDDPRFRTNPDRVANRDELLPLLREPLAHEAVRVLARGARGDPRRAGQRPLRGLGAPPDEGARDPPGARRPQDRRAAALVRRGAARVRLAAARPRRARRRDPARGRLLGGGDRRAGRRGDRRPAGRVSKSPQADSGLPGCDRPRLP